LTIFKKVLKMIKKGKIMAQAQNFRFKCRKPGCGYEHLKRYNVDEFEKLQYPNGIPCEKCGFPKTVVMRSKQTAKDGFKPGFQASINKYCYSYKEYQQELKKRGLIEMGYEDIPDYQDGVTNYWTDDVIKNMWDNGVHLSGREIEMLKAGRVQEL
jgi:hypothetical protein